MCFPSYYSIDSSLVWLWFFEVPYRAWYPSSWYLWHHSFWTHHSATFHALECLVLPSSIHICLIPFLHICSLKEVSTILELHPAFEPKFCPLFRYPHSTPNSAITLLIPITSHISNVSSHFSYLLPPCIPSIFQFVIVIRSTRSIHINIWYQ